jgi:hypothetical protein
MSNTKTNYKLKTILLLLFACLPILFFSQVSDTLERKQAPKVFLICDDCDQQFLRNEITFLNFVRDRRLADIIILVRSINAGNGGTEYSLEFSGENNFSGLLFNHKYTTTPNLSDGEIREELKKTLKKGVLPFLLKTELAEKINYSIDGLENANSSDKVKDSWNLWLFNLNGNIAGNGQSYSKQFYLNSSFNANRTSEKNLFETGFFYSGNYQKYQITDTSSVIGFVSNLGAYSYDAISVGKHLSVGYFGTYFSSTVQNLKNSTSFYPAIEYNIFPYSEATNRKLCFNYRFGLRYVDFYSPTYLDKMNDWFTLHSLVISYKQVEKWGALNCDIGSFHYFHPQKYYRINVSPGVSLNIAKGLNISLGGNFSIVNDQYFLRKDEVSSDAILLGQAQLKSDFSYFFYTGISYSFGSIYNNVVNVRFSMSDNNW